MKYFFMGAFITSMISIAFLILGLADIRPSILFNMYYQYINLGVTSFVRNGTFLEGNFAGLYFLISFILAKHFKQKYLLWILPVAVISTFSTIAIFSMFIYILFISFQNYHNSFYAVFLVMLLMVVNHKTNGIFFKEQFSEKIGIQPLALSTIERSETIKRGLNIFTQKTNGIFFKEQFSEKIGIQPLALSTIERSETIKRGLNIFTQNPLFGVGPANYKYYFNHLKNTDFDNSMNIKHRSFIANNIYIELLAEYGIFAFLTFFILIWKLFYNVQKQKLYYLSSGLIVVMIYFVAYPSFSVFFLWFFFAILSLEKPQYVNR